MEVVEIVCHMHLTDPYDSEVSGNTCSSSWLNDGLSLIVSMRKVPYLQQPDPQQR